MWKGFWFWFREDLRWPLFGTQGGALAVLGEALARELDTVRKDCVFVRNQYTPQTCAEELVPLHARARGIRRLAAEDESSFRLRVSQAFAWQHLGGGQQGLPIILDAHGFSGVQIENMRRQNPVRWAEFDLVLEEPEHQDVFLAHVEWLISLVNEYKPARSILRTVRINSPLYSCQPFRLDVSKLDKEYLDRAAGIQYGDVLLCYPALESSEALYAPPATLFWSAYSAYSGLVPYLDRPFLDLWCLDTLLLEATQITVAIDESSELPSLDGRTDLYTRKNIARSQAVTDDRCIVAKHDCGLDSINYRLDHPARISIENPWRLDAPVSLLDGDIALRVRIYDEFFTQNSAAGYTQVCTQPAFWLNSQHSQVETPAYSARGLALMAGCGMLAQSSNVGVGALRKNALQLDAQPTLDKAWLHGDPLFGAACFSQMGLCPGTCPECLAGVCPVGMNSRLSDWVERAPLALWHGGWTVRPWLSAYGYWLTKDESIQNANKETP